MKNGLRWALKYLINPLGCAMAEGGGEEILVTGEGEEGERDPTASETGRTKAGKKVSPANTPD